jgi:hypothetical protein
MRDDDLDRDKLRKLTHDWVSQEHWFQMVRGDAENYEWPVLGSRQAALEGEDAFYLYRDAFVPLLEASTASEAAFDSAVRLYADVMHSHPIEAKRFESELFTFDASFRAQWKNLFGEFTWPGLTHESLALYSRKYEVEWPLRCLVCLRDLMQTGTFDATLKSHRDSSGRLRKGRVVAYIADGLGRYPELQSAIRRGYSPALRNAIGHNDYVVENDAVRSLDGKFIEATDDVWRRVQSLQSVQNALLWICHAATRSFTPNMAQRGIVVIAWLPVEHGGLPHALIGQLAPFHDLDERADWLTSAEIWFEDEKMFTQFAQARPRGGSVVPELRPVLDKLARSAKLIAEIVPVMPCLHKEDLDHLVLTTDEGVYCEYGQAVKREISVVFRQS